MFQYLSTLSIWQLSCLAVLFFLAAELGQILFAAIYNLYFHPLKDCPGSFWDIALPFNRYVATAKGVVPQTIKKRHEKYGEIVRIAPNILSFTSPQAWKDIYGHVNDMPKTLANIGFSDDSIFAAQKADHRRLRKLMSPVFAEKSLLQQEQLIKVHVELLISKLNGIQNMTRWFTAVTFDIMGDLAFGHQLQGLNNKTNTWVETLDKVIYLVPFLDLVTTTKFGPLIQALLRPQMVKLKAEKEAYVQKLVDERLSKENRGDFMDHLIGSLNGKELTANADLFMSAASHTSTIVLSGTMYHLLANPEALAKVQDEVRGAFSDSNQISFSTCAGLPYLQACIDETMRVFPPVPIAMERKTVVPTKICGKIIPPGTVVGTPHLAIYHSDRYFTKPLEFHPERWLAKDSTSEFYNDRREVFHPFSYGSHDCIGQNLARHEMRLILAKILYTFDVQLQPDCKNWSDQRIYAIWEMPPLNIDFTRRS